ncbi:MAG: hypothetical protein M1817_002762 [Caeruleum heppii]|nr:MAG: hypothetical protein M1817_002762 [Caeruleum heppii]
MLEKTMVKPPKILTGDRQAIDEFIDKFDIAKDKRRNIGVLWSGDHVFDGTVAVLEMLRRKKKQIVFVTNNSTKSREDYKKKLDGLGIPANVDEIFGSAYSSSIYISRILQLPAPRNKTFILGESGIEAELRSENLPFIGGTDPSLRRPVTADDFAAIASGAALDPEVGCVLAGLDYHVNYLKLSLAYHYLARGATFLATNTDATLPNSHTLFPGAGSISIPLINMLGPSHPGPIVMGKPSTAMMDAIEGKFRFDRRKAVMVGDRLDTDIRFGRESGLGGTLGVGTGVMKKGDWEGGDEASRENVPGWWADRLGDLVG